jgi:hypothetical protein
MQGLDLKAECVRAGVQLYRIAAEAGMHPNRLAALLNNRAPLDSVQVERIRAAIERLSPAEPVR